jgi:hypothetical protein
MRVLAVAAVVGLLVPSAATAQFSVLGHGTLESSPVFTSGALVHDRGGFSIGGFFARVSDEEDTDFGTFSSDANVFGFGGAFGVTDRITIGASVPFVSVKGEIDGEELFDDSGLGDASLFAGWQLFRSSDDRTKLAALADVTFPTGSEDIGLGEATTFGIGGAISHQAERVSAHASLGFDVVSLDVEEGSDADDSFNVINYSAAIVYRATDMVNVSGELFGAKPEDVDASNAIGLGARLLLGADRNLFLDGGIVFGLGDEADFDTGFVVAATFVR